MVLTCLTIQRKPQSEDKILCVLKYINCIPLDKQKSWQSQYIRSCSSQGSFVRLHSERPGYFSHFLYLLSTSDELQWNSNYVPVISKTAHPPPGQSPGIWLALSSVPWGIWPKMRPARWGIWLSSQNACQRSETKGFRDSLIQHASHVHGSLLLSIPSGFSCCCPFYIVISWTMPLFKVRSEDKLNKKFVVAENFAELVSKCKRFCLYSFISWVTCLKGGGFDPLWSSNGWGIWPSILAT